MKNTFNQYLIETLDTTTLRFTQLCDLYRSWLNHQGLDSTFEDIKADVYEALASIKLAGFIITDVPTFEVWMGQVEAIFSKTFDIFERKDFPNFDWKKTFEAGFSPGKAFSKCMNGE